MSLLDELQVFGADIQDGLKRFAGNAALYEKMLRKFPAAVEKLPVMSCFESGDIDSALANAHTLKGMTGNLSLTPLYEAYTDIVAMLRDGQTEAARAMQERTEPVQADLVACIVKHA